MSGVALGLDLGTSGVRAALVDRADSVVAIAGAPIAADQRRTPQAWWDAVQTAIAGVGKKASLAGVRFIAVDGTSGSIVPVDVAGRPLAPASLYNDAADPDDAAQVASAAPVGSAARGSTSPLARALRWRHLAGLACVLHEADWLAGSLLGRFGTTDWNNALKTGFDPQALVWPDWIANAGLDPSLLPHAVAPGTALGRLNAAAARLLRLPLDAQVVAGTTDGCAAFLATGAAMAGDGVTSLGTTLTIKQLSPVPVSASEYGIYSHRIGDLWLPGGASNSGGKALARHFTPDQLATLSARINPDHATPLDYYPLPAPGERFPISDSAMAPREAPRPADDSAFLHGLLEGIARIEAHGYHRIAELGGPRLTRVFTMGGGAGNPVWTRIRARVLGVDLPAPRSHEAAVGAAVLALRAEPH